MEGYDSDFALCFCASVRLASERFKALSEEEKAVYQDRRCYFLYLQHLQKKVVLALLSIRVGFHIFVAYGQKA